MKWPTARVSVTVGARRYEIPNQVRDGKAALVRPRRHQLQHF